MTLPLAPTILKVFVPTKEVLNNRPIVPLTKSPPSFFVFPDAAPLYNVSCRQDKQQGFMLTINHDTTVAIHPALQSPTHFTRSLRNPVATISVMAKKPQRGEDRSGTRAN